MADPVDSGNLQHGKISAIKTDLKEDEDNGRQRPSFSMAQALAMLRRRQEQQLSSKQEEEKQSEEQLKEKAREKRKRRRKNQKLAKANKQNNDGTVSTWQETKEESAADLPAATNDNHSQGVKRAHEESDDGDTHKAAVLKPSKPKKKRKKRKRRNMLEAEANSDMAAKVEENDDEPANIKPMDQQATTEAIAATKTKPNILIPRALMVKRKQTR